jgi:ABC-type glutathione transport system ATPase component
MNNLIRIKNLSISFKENNNVVDNINIDIPKGKTVAIVGESGSGKTLSALSILKLLPSNATINKGSIIFNDKDLLKLPLKEIEK